MKVLQIDKELLTLIKEIYAEDKNLIEWRASESSGMFQSKSTMSS